MSNLISYQSYTPPPAAPAESGAGVRIHIGTGTQTASVVDGVMTDTFRAHEKGHSGELNPHHGEDSVLATAQHPRGLPVYQIEPTTLITIDGLQAPVSFWVSEGRLQKGADGKYAAAPAAAPAAPQIDQDHDALPAEIEAVVAHAFEGLAPQQVDAVMGCVIGAASGKLNPSVALRKFGEYTGHDAAEASARLAPMQVYQAQADRALKERSGLTDADLPDFYAWAKANRQDQLHDAIGRQIHMKDVSGYRVLAAQWVALVPPSLDAFKAGGIPVKTQDGKALVWINGAWMSPAAAARAGLA